MTPDIKAPAERALRERIAREIYDFRFSGEDWWQGYENAVTWRQEQALVKADAILALLPAPTGISADGPHAITDARRWLARQLLDSKLSDKEAFGVVAYHPNISAPSPTAKGEGKTERFAKHYLERLEYQTTGRDPKLNGYAYAKVPDWALRQLLDSHADDATAAASPQAKGEVERRQIWREVQLMAAAGLETQSEGSPAWNAFADIHAFAVGQQLGERDGPMNLAAAPSPPEEEAKP